MFGLSRSSPLPKNIPANANIYLLDYQLLYRLVMKGNILSSYKIVANSLLIKNDIVQQMVTAHTDQDIVLIGESQRIHNKEVMQLSISTIAGEIFYSPIYSGTVNVVGNQKSIERYLQHRLFELRKIGHEIKAVSINHVHPTPEFFLFKENWHMSITNGLSHSDIQIAKNIASHLQYPLMIKAIVPSGLSYSFRLEQCR